MEITHYPSDGQEAVDLWSSSILPSVGWLTTLGKKKKKTQKTKKQKLSTTQNNKVIDVEESTSGRGNSISTHASLLPLASGTSQPEMFTLGRKPRLSWPRSRPHAGEAFPGSGRSGPPRRRCGAGSLGPPGSARFCLSGSGSVLLRGPGRRGWRRRRCCCCRSRRPSGTPARSCPSGIGDPTRWRRWQTGRQTRCWSWRRRWRTCRCPPRWVRRGRHPAGRPVRGSGLSSRATVADPAGGACVSPGVSRPPLLALPRGPREGIAFPRRGVGRLAWALLAPSVLLQIFQCQGNPAFHEPEVLCSGIQLVCITASGVIWFLGAKGHLEGIRIGSEWQLHSPRTKLWTLGVGYGRWDLFNLWQSNKKQFFLQVDSVVK